MAKRPDSAVTSSEMAMLQILWESSRPLNKQEIMEKANEDEPLFAKNSFHVLINELIAKGYLVPVDNMGLGRKNARRYAPTVSRNEFWAAQVSSSKNFRPMDIPEVLASLMDFSPDGSSEAVLDGIEKIIKRKREEAKEGEAKEGEPKESELE